MISKRNLGPVLALTGAGIAVAAVIAGFILVGGPGDARDRRLDNATMNRVHDVVYVAQCAFNVSGSAPASIEDAHAIIQPPTPVTPVPDPCGGGAPIHQQIKTGDQPAAPGDVVYRAVDATHIRVCGNFRRDLPEYERDDFYRPNYGAYPQLRAPRPAGVHCYDIELIKGADLSRYTVSHAGHMDVFE